MLICFMAATACFPQEKRYNRQITLLSDTLSEQISGTVELNGRTYAIAGLYDDHYTRIGIAEIDHEGNKLWAKAYGDDTAHYYQPGFYQAATATSDGNIMATGLLWNWQLPFNARTVLIKFNPSGDTLWTRLIMPELYPDVYTRGRGLIETQDKGFAIMGDTQDLAFFCKTDSLGRVEWYKTFPGVTSGQAYDLNSVHQLPDGNYLLSGTLKNLAANESWICIVGGEGDVTREWKIPGESDAFAITDRLGGFLVASAKWVGTQQNLLHLLHYNASGDLDSERIYGDTMNHYRLSALAGLPDSTFLVSGWNDYTFKAFVFCVNRKTDSLFYRDITCYAPDSSFDKRYSFHSVTVCSDSSIFLGGEYDTLVGHSLVPRGWVVRADRYGCIAQGCDPNAIYIYRQPATVNLPDGDTVGFSVGATGDSLVFQWQFRSDSTWSNIADTLHFVMAGDSLRILTSGLQPGIYRIRCRIFNEAYTAYSQEALLQIPSGTGESGKPGGLCIYPNPSADILYIWSETPVLRVKVTGFSGIECTTIAGNNRKDLSFSLGRFPAGIYTITVVTSRGCMNRKIIKQ